MHHTPSTTYRFSMTRSLTQSELTRLVRNQYTGRLSILYDRILRYWKLSYDKSQTLWNINLNVPAHSMKGCLMLFEDTIRQVLTKIDIQRYFTSKQLPRVEMTIEGVPTLHPGITCLSAAG